MQTKLMRWCPTIPDSDQSISDEDEPDGDWPNNCATLGGSAEKKEELQLPSRLEMLKGINVYACNLEDEVSSEDDEEKKGINVFSKMSDTVCAKKLQIDDHRFGCDKHDGSYVWSAASKEAEALMRLNEKALCSSSQSTCSKVNKSSKGVKGKGKPKFSFRFPTHKEGPSWLSMCKDENDVSFKVQQVPGRLDAFEPRIEENSDAELLEDIQGEDKNQLEIVPIDVRGLGHRSAEQSMAELLDGLHDKTTMLRGSSEMYGRKRLKRGQLVVKSVSSLGDRTIDSESFPEHTDNQIVMLANPEVKRQTLVDRFQEALSDRALVAVPKTLRNGLFGKLQQVVQSEKENDMQFFKKNQERARQDEPSYIDVKILSRYLDAKLTVCHCFSGNNLKSLPCIESPKEMVNEGTGRTIIFNPRVCNDVDLDIGKWIRIHSPWKEIHVGNDKSIILSTYFSEISI